MRDDNGKQIRQDSTRDPRVRSAKIQERFKLRGRWKKHTFTQSNKIQKLMFLHVV
jgi:hypothetical protein